MAVREVVRYPHPALKGRAESISPGPDAERLARDLVETMRSSPACVGLAAPQIGEPLRVFCLDVTGHRRATASNGLVVMLDPIVESADGREVVREGCMSLPDLTANVARATSIVVAGLSPEGASIRFAAAGFEARAFQHEIDHLDGLLFLDRVSSLQTEVFRRKRYAR